jgi:Secretion system C-terminal sorting domain
MRTLFALSIGLWLHTAIAQPPGLPSPESGLKYSIGYTLEESSFLRAGTDTSNINLSPIDIEWMRPLTTIKQVERRVTEDNHHSTTIIILNPEEAYADFPHHIGRIEINQQGIQVYDTDDSLYLNIPAEVEYQADYNSMRNLLAESTVPIMYDFPTAPDSATIQVIQGAGGTVTMLANGVWEISGNGNTTRFEPGEGRITRTNYEGNVVSNIRIQEFLLTEQGIYAPLEDITKMPVIRPSGACMEDVTRKRYSNYTMAVIPSERTNYPKAGLNKSTRIWPNPAGGKLFVALGTEVMPGSALRIFDLFGKEVHRQPVIQSGSDMEIQLQSLAEGVYFVRLETKGGLQTLKFIKRSN